MRHKRLDSKRIVRRPQSDSHDHVRDFTAVPLRDGLDDAVRVELERRARIVRVVSHHHQKAVRREGKQLLRRLVVQFHADGEHAHRHLRRAEVPAHGVPPQRRQALRLQSDDSHRQEG
jgi:hypothetical protein